MAVIHISARQYWRKGAGYTLQSVRVWVDGQDVGVHELTQSRERSGAIELGMKVLERAGFDPGVARPMWDSSWTEAGHTLALDCTWVGKMSDAHGVHGTTDGVLLWRVFRDGVWRDALEPVASA